MGNNKLSASTIPNLQPPCGPVASASTPSPLPPPASSSSTSNTPWYRSTYRDEDDDDDPKSSRPPLDMDLAGASTPLTNRAKMNAVPSSESSNISMSFMSPISKLDNLHLESEIDLHEQASPRSGRSDDDEEDDDDDDDEEAFSLGDKTITNDSGSDIEFREDNDDDDGFAASSGLVNSSPPVFVNRRKRHHIESPAVSVITPQNSSVVDYRRKYIRPSHAGAETRALTHDDTNDYDKNNDQDEHMSICNTTSASSLHKLSFSNSDSTPCPVHPKRKKLKFKNSNDSTPSTRPSSKRLLNLSHSKKTDVNSIISQLHAHQPQDLCVDDEDEDISSSSPPPSAGFSQAQLQSTPISQSTPANSRSSTPPGAASSEYGDDINGYKFVKPVGKPQPQYTYQTPVSNPTSADLRQAYTRNDHTPLARKYQIVGEFPVTSAGLMDESNGDIHIGDKRINDPYLRANSSKASTSGPGTPTQSRDVYLASTKLPVESAFYEIQENLPISRLLELVSDKTKVRHFYTQVLLADESELDLLRAERIRWHPDKWTARLRDSPVPLHFNTQVLDRLTQVLNELIEDGKHTRA